jgi:uncharacterized protein YukJ
MPLHAYGVFAGSVLASRSEGGSGSPHFQIRLRGDGQEFRVAVNVLSQQSPPELLYVADENFRHPVLDGLPSLPDGFTAVDSRGSGLAMDFIRANLFDRTSMLPMPATAPGPDNDLADKLDHYTSRAGSDAGARVYAFGERWGPDPTVPDQVFGFSPGNGVHDIHMNQGNSGEFTRDDGVWQDGALLFNFPSSDQWVAIFLAFQSQAWHTDDQTGHALAGPEPGPTPHPDADRPVRIVAALVNPAGPAPEQETVTLINAGAAPVDLTGWSLVDRLAHRMSLDPGILPPGETVRIRLHDPIQLGNGGGTLTLVDAAGLKADGIAYTAHQASAEGATLVF